MKLKLNNFTIAFSLILILNIFLHFCNLSQQITWVDEPIYIVGATKLHLQQGSYDPLQWNFEHPPTAKYLIGLTAIFSPANKKPILDLTPNNYLGLGYPDVAKSIDDSLFFARLSPAIFGILLSAVIFFFAKDLYGKRAGIVAFFISTISIDILTWSRLAYLDIYLVFFFTSSVYIFYKIVSLPSNTENKKSKNKIIYSILMGLFLGLGFTTKSTQPIPLLSSVFILSLFYRKQIYNKQVLPLIIFFFVAAVFFSIGNLDLFTKAAFQYFGATNRQLSPTNLFPNVIRVLERIQTPLIALFLASLYLLYRKKELLKNKIILFPLVFSFFSFVVSVNISHRYFLPMIPFFILTISSANLRTKNLKLFAAILLILSLYSTLEAFPEYTLYTNLIDSSTGSKYFWEEAGFAGLDESAKYVDSATHPEDLIFITQDAIRYRLFDRNIIALEAGQGLLYLTDQRVGQTNNIFCDGVSKFKQANITLLIIQNPKTLDETYCDGLKQIYNAETPAYTINKRGLDVIKIFRL